MSPIIVRVVVFLSGVMMLLSAGCSDPRAPRSLINPETGKHSVQWEAPDSHGAAAKAAVGSTTGFAVCQGCHSSDFAGGISNITCLNTAGCHGAAVRAPHSPKPWRGGTRTHTNTDQSNASVCALCHANGANSSLQPSPFDSGAAPGCFNNTLCHAAVGHPAGWANADYHGATAKSAPSSTAGFSYCQICHGNDFTGSLAQQSCLNTAGCHGAGVGAPHSPKPWRSGTRTHTDTDQGNAAVCALCHTNGANSAAQPSSFDPSAAPGCFNNTLCHAAVGHPDGWANPDSHGVTAKSAPTSTSGFSLCQTCHGNDFAGGNALKTCLNTAGCHGVGVNAPHAASWLPGDTYTHTTTDQGNASVCGLCHLGNRQPPAYATFAQTVGCFDNTLCHGAQGHAAGWANPSSHGATAKSTPGTTSGFSYCQSCHGDNFAGGTSLQTCMNTAGCHGASVSAPHSPTPWRGGTQTHTTTNFNNASVCANCHTNGANSSVQPSPYDPLATPGCFNNTLCHAVVSAPHAVPFTDPALHGPLAKSDLTYCQACHANPSSSGAGSNPRFNVAIGSLANGCENCHVTNMAHPALWKWENATFTGHQTAGTLVSMANACALCHGATLGGDITINSPACTSCHTAGSPLTKTNCTSCHGKPPTGSAYPDVAGKHTKHNALANITGICNTCHNGSGTNTVNHDYGGGVVDVAFLGTTYNAKSGSAAYNAVGFSCSNVSCHGGQTTPSWLTGSINVNSQCTSCHTSGTTQYNSYNSGEHTKHIVDVGADCIDCHDTSKLANVHFNDLNTTAMLQSAQTMTNVYNTSGKYCAFTCHLHGTNKLHDSGMTW